MGRFSYYTFFMYRLFIKLYIFYFFVSLVFITSTFSYSVQFPFFQDLEKDSPYFSAITYLSQENIINGYTDGTFKPYNNISRAEAIKILMESSTHVIQSSKNNPFFDVPANKWFSKYIYTAKILNIVKGDGKTGAFYPEKTVNKAEAVKMIIETNNLSINKSLYTNSWYEPYFMTALNYGIIDNLQSPEKNLTRAEFSYLIYNYLLAKQRNENGFIGKASINEELLNNYIYHPSLKTGTKVIITSLSNGKTFPAVVKNKNIALKDVINTSYEMYKNLELNDYSNEILIHTYSKNLCDFEDKNCFIENNQLKDSLLPPQSLEAKYNEGKLFLSFESSSLNYFHFIFIQDNVRKDFYTNEKSISFEPDFWKEFKNGEILVLLQGAKNKDSVMSSFVELKIPVYKRFYSYLKKTAKYLDSTWEYINDISANIETSEKLINPKGFVLNSDNVLYTKEIIQNDKKLNITFYPKKKDLYIIEFSDQNELVQAIIPFSPKGYYPILPTELDLLKSSNSYTISDIYDRINVFRAKNGKNPLKIKESLSGLASSRATDMVNRNYFSHYSPEGETADSLRSAFSINGHVMENIAVNSESLMHSAMELEFSPYHRNILLNDDLEFMGIATKKDKDGSFLLVEIFQKKVLSEMDLEIESSDLYKYFNDNYIFLEKSIEMQNIANDWSKVMAEKSKTEIDFGYGYDWKSVLDDYDIEGDTSIFILSHESPKKMLEYFKENKSVLDSTFKDKVFYGLSLAIDKNGVVYLTIIANKPAG